MRECHNKQSIELAITQTARDRIRVKALNLIIISVQMRMLGSIEITVMFEV